MNCGEERRECARHASTHLPMLSLQGKDSIFATNRGKRHLDLMPANRHSADLHAKDRASPCYVCSRPYQTVSKPDDVAFRLSDHQCERRCMAPDCINASTESKAFADSSSPDLANTSLSAG